MPEPTVELNSCRKFVVIDIDPDRALTDNAALPGAWWKAVGTFDPVEVVQLKYRMRTRRHVMQHALEQPPPLDLLATIDCIGEPISCSQPALNGANYPAHRDTWCSARVDQIEHGLFEPRPWGLLDRVTSLGKAARMMHGDRDWPPRRDRNGVRRPRSGRDASDHR